MPDSDNYLRRFSPRVLAATLDRAIRYWSGASHANCEEAADAFRADSATMREATPLLQKQLQLSTTRNW